MEIIPLPVKPETANLILDPAVNAALDAIADKLSIAKSAYVEALLRVKFGVGLALKNFAKEGLYQHLLCEGLEHPPELADFAFDPQQRQTRKSGNRRRVHVQSSSIGNISAPRAGTVVANTGNNVKIHAEEKRRTKRTTQKRERKEK